MSGPRWLPVVLVACLAWPVLISPDGRGALAQGEAAALQDAADRLFERSDIQFELPEEEGSPDDARGSVKGEWRIEERDLFEPRKRLELDLELPPFFSLLLWAVAICGGLVLLYWLLDSLSGFAWPSARRGSEAEPQAAEARPQRVLDEAERLAAEGRFEDALHALLLHGLGILRHRLGRRVAAALTSREILELSDLPEAGRAALRDLVARVELTYFGERPADAQDYRSCRELFESFAQAMGPGR